MGSDAKPSFDPQKFLALVDGGKIISAVRPNAIVFGQGDPADSIFYIQKGKVKITVLSAEGKEAVVAILGEGDFFGEGSLAGQPKRMATSTAVTDSVILKIPINEARRVLDAEPTFSALFISHLLARNIRVEEDLVDQLFNSSEKRLARVLLLMANFGKESGPQPIIGKITQATLADMIGTTRSRVSFFMNKFRKLGLIEYNGRIKVHTALLNLILHDNPKLRRPDDPED